MNFLNMGILLLVGSIGFFDPSLCFKRAAGVLIYKCPLTIRNGYIKQLKSRGKVTCYSGYKLFGPRYVMCGLHKGAMPVCIRPGCAPPPQPSHGTWMFSRNDALGVLVCDDGFITSDEAHIYCDGLVWDSVGKRPTCTGVVNSPNTTCDFEEPGLCGWSQDFYHDFDWRRRNFTTPSGHLRTGPSFDHTFGKGFAGVYLYIEASSPRMTNETARLYSPVYPANYSEDACFIFWYHMYGSTMGSVNVYVLKKGDSLSGKTSVFSLSGDKGDLWRQAFVALDSQDSPFQIVLEGVVGHGYEGDAAVDDVKLAHGVECLPPPRPSPTTPAESASASAYTEPTVFEVSREGADKSSLNLSPLLTSVPETFPTTLDDGQILYSVPSTFDKSKSQTPLTQNSESSFPPTSFDTVTPSDIITVKGVNVTAIVRNIWTSESETQRKLTTVMNSGDKETRYTFGNFTDTRASTNSKVTTTTAQTPSIRLYSDRAFSTVTDVKVTSRPTSATLKYQTLTTPTASKLLTTSTSVSTASVLTRTSPYFTKKVTQFATAKTTAKPVTTSRVTQQKLSSVRVPWRYTTKLLGLLPKYTPLPRIINTPSKKITMYLPVRITPTTLKSATLSFVPDKKTLEFQSTPAVTIKAPSPAPSSRRNSAYQFLTSKLQQYQTPVRSKAAESSGWSVGATLGVALAASVVALAAAFLAVRLARRRLARRLQSREPEDSDVRFLTSDEILDFNIARPGDCDL